MFESAILDVAIGIVLAFLGVSLAASAMTEALSSLLKIRQKTLLTGIQNLVNDQAFTSLAKALYDHALINPLATPGPEAFDPAVTGVAGSTGSAAFTGTPGTTGATGPIGATGANNGVRLGATEKAKRTTQVANYLSSGTTTGNLPKLQTAPAYIAADQFVPAFLSIIKIDYTAPADEIETAIKAIANPQIKQTLLALWLAAEKNFTVFEQKIGAWFDNAMDRVGGYYKRYTQVIAFLCALLVAIVFNVNAIAITNTVWKNRAVIASIDTAAINKDARNASDLLDQLEAGGLVGWQSPPADAVAWIIAPLGWLMVATASLFGAPFWFDALGHLVALRGTGAKPDKKAKRAKA